MADNRRKLQAGLAAFVAFSLFVCMVTGGASARGPSGQIDFTPNIPPLQMTRTARAAAIETLVGQGSDGSPTEYDRVPLSEGLWLIQGLHPRDAIALCGGEALTWGDANAGMCQVPGGETYYIWVGRDEVLEIQITPGDMNQANFRLAVEAMHADREAYERDVIQRFLSIGGLFGSGFAIVGLCATIIGCFVGTGGAMLAVGAVAATNGNVMQDREDLECHSRQADYFYCMLQGHADATCRQEAGIPSAPNGGSCE